MTAGTRTVGEVDRSRAASRWTVRGRRVPKWVGALLRNPLSIIGILLVLSFTLVALFAPVIAPPVRPDEAFIIPRDGYSPEPQPPSAAHPFGTSQDQFDIFYGVVWGTRTAFQVGLIITALTVLIGTTIGAISGYLGGWVDEIVQRVVEIVMAFPFLLAALTLATVLAPKLHNGVLTGMIALTAFGWPNYTRLVRGEVLAVKSRDYVLAARVVGVPAWRIIFRHVLPNASTSLFVFAWLDIGGYVLVFSGLSFLGVGAEEGYADWGFLISLARNWIHELFKYWYILVFPGAALLLFSLAWNLIGDAFRDVLDPRLHSSRGE